MDVGVHFKKKTLKELEEEITCSLCKKHYTEPKILPCLHYYCKGCVLKLASHRPFACPDCGVKTTLSEKDVEELETFHFIDLLKSNFQALERVHTKSEIHCEGCNSRGKAEAFCRHCAVFICNNCVISHKKLKLFSSHELVSVEDLIQGQAKPIVLTKPVTEKCTVHGEPLLIYCFDCDSLICRDCLAIDHKGHKSQFCKVAAPETKKSLLSYLISFKEVSVKQVSAINAVRKTKFDVEAQGKSVIKDIETSFDELRQILEQRKRVLVLEASKKVVEKIKKLSEQEKKLCLANSEIQSVIKYTERLVVHCSDNKVMSMQAGIKNQVQTGMMEHDKPETTLKPEEEVDMGVKVSLNKPLKQLCQTKSKITQLAIDPAQCKVSGEGVETGKVFKTAEITLTAKKLTNNMPTRRKAVVVSELKSLYNESVVKGCVGKSGPGEYLIQYTPKVRGRHELTISVDGQQIAGSPFSVFVSVPPTELGNPIKIGVDIYKPRGITVDSENNIIVAEKKGNIFKLDKNGQKTILVEHSKTKLTELESIATDNEDNIYCTDLKSTKIMKCDKNGGNIQVYEVQQEKDRGALGYWTVIVVGDEVLLLERENKGAIMIYDKEFTDLRRTIQIDCSRATKFWDVFADVHSNLFVTDQKNDCVYIFSNNGVLQRSFSCDNNGVQKLKKPRYVRVFREYVYVTNIGGYYISVFTTTGDYVTSFGQQGSGTRDFDGPFCPCIDKNGFLYIADSWNNRVKCL